MASRNSLNFHTYIEHSISIKLAADENLNLFLKESSVFLFDNRVKLLGLFRSTMLLYAISIELIIKARGLFEEKQNIENRSISKFEDFLNRWRGKTDGHNYFKIIDFYKIELSQSERILLENFIPYTSWAGRFPYPKKEMEVINMEETGKNHGSMGKEYQKEVESFVKRQISIMS